MKKFIYILIALLTISAIAVAQIKMQVWLNDDEPAIFDYNQILKVGFVGESLPDTPSDKPDDPEDKPITPEDPEEDEFVAKLFSVSATKTVTFSPGNLQYHPANNEWRFAPNQTDYIGEDNENISSTYNGWIDLLGWGTGNNPTNASTDYNDYKTFVDWGINKIGNDAPNTWRTLTYDEWYYLRYERPNYDKLIGIAKVNGVNGIILLPDAWQCPDGIAFKSGFHDKTGVIFYGNYQTISVSDWSKLESSGAVFLPAAGSRYGSDVNSIQDEGIYQSATESYFYGSAYYLYFYSSKANISGDFICSVGQSVRLVQDVATDPDDDPVAPPVKPDDGDDDIDTPEVELPGEGKIRFIVDATAVDACYGLGIEGNFCGYDPNAAFKGTEFAENMFYIDMPSMTAEEFGNAKILLLNEDGTSSWDYQVSNESYDITASEDYITLVDEYGILNAINLVDDNIDNVIIKVAILEVEYNPCKPVPAGYAKFVLTVTGKVPVGKDVIFTGSFEEKSWGESDRVMTKQADGTYVWEGEYPENFSFKALIKDCKDLGLGADDYGYVLNELWMPVEDFQVEAESGSVIHFEGCFQYFCPGDEIPDTPTVPSDNKSFSVSATKTITFSPGNLQYHAANNEWRFAPSQTDYIGADNANISDTYNGWIDMFCWGTGNNPTNQSLDDADFQDFVDWGVNKIGNDAPNVWRTLTYDEWEYLINNRSNASNLKGIAKVNEVNGLILLPDAWVCPDGVSFKSGFNNISGVESYGNYQTISASDWSKLESSGAVFLPAAGCRLGSYIYVVQTSGNYWSTTEYNLYNANEFVFNSFDTFMNNSYRHYGFSVRLVKDE